MVKNSGRLSSSLSEFSGFMSSWNTASTWKFWVGWGDEEEMPSMSPELIELAVVIFFCFRKELFFYKIIRLQEKYRIILIMLKVILTSRTSKNLRQINLDTESRNRLLMKMGTAKEKKNRNKTISNFSPSKFNHSSIN